MRHYLRALILSFVAFYLAYSIVPTIKIGSDPKNVLVIIGGLFVITQAVHPVFSIVLLPINILTFGLLSFALNFAFLFASTYFLPGFEISAYNFQGTSINGVVIPAANLTQIATVALVAVFVTIIQKILHFVFE